MDVNDSAGSWKRRLALEEGGEGGESVEVRGGFVGADTEDAGKAQGVTAGVAVGSLDVVEGHFEDDEGLHDAEVALVFNGVFPKKLGEFQDLGIREAGVGFANVEELVAVANGERVVGEHFVTFSVAIFDSGDNDIQGGVGLL